MRAPRSTEDTARKNGNRKFTIFTLLPLPKIMTVAAPFFYPVSSSHSLAEVDTVLTALPRIPRISSSDAWQMLQDNVTSCANVVTLAGRDHTPLIDELASRGVIGGSVYDAVIAKEADEIRKRYQAHELAVTIVCIEHPLYNRMPMSDVTHILFQIESGDLLAAEQLLPLVYEELRKLAAAKLAHEKPGQTLQATALVHDAYIRLVDVDKAQHWDSRGHFFAAAAEAMRRILVERARRKRGPKQGGDRIHVRLDQAPELSDPRSAEVLAVNDALDLLAQESPPKAELVKLRYFVGMSHQEAAEALGISRATADRYWAYAKAFLLSALRDAGER